MKRFTRNPKDVLLPFNDEHSKIDTKFKADLRTKLQQREMSAHKQPQGSHRPWRQFALATTATAVVVSTALVLTLGNPTSLKAPLTPQKVSAIELLKRSAALPREFDVSKYNYFERSFFIEYGPTAGFSCASSEEAHTWEPKNSASKEYVYRAHDNGIEAYYLDATSSDSDESAPLAVYDTTPEQIIGDFLLPVDNLSLQETLGTYIIDGKPSVFVVDENGKEVTVDEVPLTQFDGRDAYVFYIKENAELLRSDPNVSECGDNILSKITVDAHTYEALRIEQYEGSVRPENLRSATGQSINYMNIAADEALVRMEKAGFDKSKAAPYYQAGHDSPAGDGY